jgi:hypothetical protein
MAIRRRRRKAKRNPARKARRRTRARRNPRHQARYTSGKRKGQFKKTRKKAKAKAKRRRTRVASYRAFPSGKVPRSMKRRSRTRKGKRRGRKGGSVSVKRLRSSRNLIRRAKKRPAKSRARKALTRYGLKSNPGAMLDAMKKVLPIAATFYGSKFVASKVGTLGPVANVLGKLPMGGKLNGPILSGVVLAGVHYGTKKGALSKQRGPMMLGAAFALVDSLFAAFAPASVAGMFGVQAVGEYFPMSEYVAQSDYVPMSDYSSTDQAPRALHEVWGVHGIEGELGEDYGSLTPNW